MIDTNSEWSFQITEFDRLLRELDIIDNIFKSQFQTFDRKNLFDTPYPMIQNSQGKSENDGKYINCHNIWSTQEFINLTNYKKYYSERFEKSNNNTLLNNEIKDVLDKAEKARDFYNNNLANQNEILQEFIQYNDNQEFEGFKDYEQLMLWEQEHEAQVFISNYIIDQICYGVAKWKDYDKYKFHYKLSNYELATFCQDVVDFFGQFKDGKLQANSAALFIDHKSSKKINGSIYNEKKIGYKWQGKETDLVSFFEELKNRKLIDSNTQLQDFLIIFSAGNLENIIKVKWLDTTTNLLFFILQMMEGDLIAKESRMNYERMRSCFSKRDGSPFNDKLKEIKHLIAKGQTTNNRMITELIKQYY